MKWITEHHLYLLLALGTMLSAGWLIKNKAKLRVDTVTAIALAVLHTLFGVLSVKLFAFLEGAGPGAMSLFGGVFFMPLLYLIGAKIFKRRAADVCDTFTPCMIITLLLARVNCLLAGCCQGNVIHFVQDRTLRWPTREAEIGFYVLMLVWMLPRILLNEKASGRSARRKGFVPGTLYPIYMAAYGVFRFVIEFFRASDSGTLFHIAHLWAALSFCIGAAIVGEKKARRKKKGSST